MSREPKSLAELDARAREVARIQGWGYERAMVWCQGQDRQEIAYADALEGSAAAAVRLSAAVGSLGTTLAAAGTAVRSLVAAAARAEREAVGRAARAAAAQEVESPIPAPPRPVAAVLRPSRGIPTVKQANLLKVGCDRALPTCPRHGKPLRGGICPTCRRPRQD